MERRALSPADWASLSRLPLAFLFLLMFRAQPGSLLAACVVMALVAQISDHLDGFLARRRGPPPASGWLFDSVADRAFYLAALLAFDREFGLAGPLIWLFILRELGVYVLWIAVGDFEELWPGFRVLSLVHAGLVRAAIALGCAIPYWFAEPGPRQASLAAVAALLAAATAFGYYCLFLVFRSSRDEAARDRASGGPGEDGPVYP